MFKLTNFTPSSEEVSKKGILGTFEGECALASMTNLNGMDISRDVWVKLFNSDDFKKGIQHKWYIGFLGHPQDPECQEFQNGCIIMIDGKINDDDVVWGKFELVATPVGKIVKTWIDAGVEFGISVRGVGDLIGNSVDPDTFVFKGFDLVAFPAYPDSIPVFSEIAASTNSLKRKQYQKICAAVDSQLSAITSCEALDMIQKQFAPQSEQFKKIEDRKHELEKDPPSPPLSGEEKAPPHILEEKLNGMMELYLAKCKEVEKLKSKIEEVENTLYSTEIACNRKIKSIERITADQIESLNNVGINANKKIKSLSAINSKLKSEILASNNENSKIISQIKKDNLRYKQDNLKYKQDITAANKIISEQKQRISSLTSDLDKTVAEVDKFKRKTSNCDVKIQSLQSEIKACYNMIEEYQQSYANMYANAIGVYIKDVPVSASTSVTELQKIISNAPSKDVDDLMSLPDIADYTSEDEDTDIVTI